MKSSLLKITPAIAFGICLSGPMFAADGEEDGEFEAVSSEKLAPLEEDDSEMGEFAPMLPSMSTSGATITLVLGAVYWAVVRDLNKTVNYLSSSEKESEDSESDKKLAITSLKRLEYFSYASAAFLITSAVTTIFTLFNTNRGRYFADITTAMLTGGIGVACVLKGQSYNKLAHNITNDQLPTRKELIEQSLALHTWFGL